MRIATALLTVLLLFPLSCQAEETESNHTPSSSTKSTSAPEEPSEPAEGAPVDTAQSEEVEVSEVEAILNDNSINQLWDALYEQACKEAASIGLLIQQGDTRTVTLRQDDEE